MASSLSWDSLSSFTDILSNASLSSSYRTIQNAIKVGYNKSGCKCDAAIFSTWWGPCAEEMDYARCEVPTSRGSLTVVTLSNTAPTQATPVSEGKILISTSPEKVR